MEKYGLLFELIFKKKLTDTGTVSYLEKVATEHPYFSIAQFYLLCLSEKDNTAYHSQAKKTAALFNNNYWLSFQMQQVGHHTAQSNIANNASTKDTATSNQEIIFEAQQQENNTSESTISESLSNAPFSLVANATLQMDRGTESNNVETPVELHETNDKDEVIIEEEIPHSATTLPSIVTEQDRDMVSTEETQIAQNQELPVALNQTETSIGINTQELLLDAEPIEEAQPYIPTQEETNTVSDTTDTIQTDQSNLLHTASLQPEIVPDNNDSIPPDNNKGLLTAETNAEATTTATDALLFEPLHTTDYFASVGIKLSEEERGADKLGKQLKSFTEWLKTLKRAHVEPQPSSTIPMQMANANTESGIQTLADKSNQEDDVVTEAMADVLLQQGKYNKALEILEKLSLLNPGKSTYFAAKINQIKEK